ncbi:MAG: hypothetical protein K5770_13535 [Lachnospiraceae bacterium]|nr:hypothetical protein [Lachnospiraceae bacterium]
MISRAVLGDKDRQVVNVYSGKEESMQSGGNTSRIQTLAEELSHLCDGRDIGMKTEGTQFTYFVFDRAENEINVFVSLQPYITKSSWEQFAEDSGDSERFCLLCNLNKSASEWNGKNALIIESGLMEKVFGHAEDTEKPVIATPQSTNPNLYNLNKAILNETGIKSISLKDHVTDRDPYGALAEIIMEEINNRIKGK